MAQRKYENSYPEFFPLDDMYYTLEMDFEDWENEKNKKKQQKAKTEAKGASTPEEEDKKKRKASTSSSRELRSLLSDVKTKKRSRTAPGTVYIYEGQEELYESLETVLTKLKDYSEHSYPFLTKVRASDAPDYYEVIKKPMDLGLMMKKLKRGEYSSKSEFQADLNLIYTNCRIYNTDPSSRIYLDHADHLEKRSKELMKTVKNIDFTKERKTRESNPNISPTTTPTPDDEEAHKQTNLQASTDSTTSNNNNNNSTSSNASTPTSNFTNKTPKQKSPDKEKYITSPISPIKIDLDLDNETIQSKTDLYRCLTKQFRLQKLAYAKEQDKLPFGERDALQRDPERMAKFMVLNGYDLDLGLPEKDDKSKPTIPPSSSPMPPPPETENDNDNEKDTDKDKEKEEGEGEKEKEKRKQKQKEITETAYEIITKEVGFFPEICFVADSVPELYPCISRNEEKDYDDDATTNTTTNNNTETNNNNNENNNNVNNNNNVVIKKEEEKEEETRAVKSTPNTPTTPPLPTSPPSASLSASLSPSLSSSLPSSSSSSSSSSSLSPAPLHFHEFYNALLRKTIAVVLSKSGFVSVGSAQVMDVMTDLVNGYLLRLGKILKTHVDDLKNEVPFEEIFSRALCEMGVPGVEALMDYMNQTSDRGGEGGIGVGDLTRVEFDPRNSFFNRSVGLGANDYLMDMENEERHAEGEEEMAGHAAPESGTGRQKRQVTKVSDRDNMYEYYEDEQHAEQAAANQASQSASASSSAKVAKQKKIVQKKSVKPQPNSKKRSKNVPNVVTKKKKQ